MNDTKMVNQKGEDYKLIDNKNCSQLSIGYLSLVILTVVFLLVILLGTNISAVPAALFMVVILAISFEAIAIILITNFVALKKSHPNANISNLFINVILALLIIGLFTVITAIVAACIIINIYKKIEFQDKIDYNASQFKVSY